jgi:hypothetical protein
VLAYVRDRAFRRRDHDDDDGRRGGGGGGDGRTNERSRPAWDRARCRVRPRHPIGMDQRMRLACMRKVRTGQKGDNSGPRTRSSPLLGANQLTGAGGKRRTS